MKYRNFILSAFLGISIASPAFAGNGGESGGGGNICFPTGASPVLLDIANQVVNDLHSGSRLKVTKKMKKAGFDRIDSAELAVWQDLESILKRYEATSPRPVKVIRQALAGLNFYGTPYSVNQPIRADFSQTPACSAENVKAAVVYSLNWAVISLPLWNQLDKTSQVALILHEAFRNIQIRYLGKQSDLELQKITSFVMFGNAHTDLNETEFFKAYFKDKPTETMVQNESTHTICDLGKEDLPSVQMCAEVTASEEIKEFLDSVNALCSGSGGENIYDLSVKSRNYLMKAIYEHRLDEKSDSEKSACSLTLLYSQTAFMAMANAQLGGIVSQMQDNEPDLRNAIAGLENIPVQAALKFLKK